MIFLNNCFYIKINCSILCTFSFTQFYYET
nr:MAG TPA: hypothetical protein [Caudoviricetes sp.]